MRFYGTCIGGLCGWTRIGMSEVIHTISVTPFATSYLHSAMQPTATRERHCDLADYRMSDRIRRMYHGAILIGKGEPAPCAGV